MGLFRTAKCIGGKVTRPLEKEGDTTHRIYHLECVVDADAYTTLAQTAVLSNAATAGVDVLPAGFANASAYFAGDTKPEPFQGALVKFTRSFATKPANQSEVLVGSSTYSFPGRGFVSFKVPATEEDASSDENLYEAGTFAANTSPGPLYESKTYWIAGVDSPPTVPARFVPTLDGAAVDFVRNAASKTWTNATALNGDTFSASLSLSATSPTRTAYEAEVSAGTLKVIDVEINRYAGPIFVMKTFKMAAQ
jgi:hypothetical protein